MKDARISLLVGKIGSGKTYLAIKRCLDAFMTGQVVVTNVRLKWEAVAFYCRKRGVTVPPANYRYFETESIMGGVDSLLDLLTPGCYLLFDEMHLVMDSRSWQQNAKDGAEFQTLTTQARKLGVDMDFITQDLRNLDAKVVRQCGTIIRITNWRHFPFLGDWLPLNLSLVRYCAPDGKTVEGREWIRRRSEVFACYDSHQTFVGIALRGEAAAHVVGKRARSSDYGWKLCISGGILLVVDNYWHKKAVVAAGAVTS